MANWLRLILVFLGIFVAWATLSIITFDDSVKVDYKEVVR